MRARWRTGTRALLGAILAVSIWAMPSCVATEPIEDVACKVASDCAPPYVCCSRPRIPSEDTPPVSCQDIQYCDAYLPFLLAGQPCGRFPVSSNSSSNAPTNPCSAGLVCCPSTLTCGSDGACPEAPVPPTTPSGAACLSDPDCPGGEICCNIDFFNRANGRCTSVPGCGGATPQLRRRRALARRRCYALP